MTKFIEKAIEDENTGADVKYHEIIAVSVDYKNHNTVVTVESYISQKTKQAGKMPVGSPVSLNINTAPDMSENVADWAYAQLIQAVPEGYQELQEEERGYGWVNPYKFSGGKIKDS